MVLVNFTRFHYENKRFSKIYTIFSTDYLDEDEKAFERLNSGRMYSSRMVDPETCKQQVSPISVTQFERRIIYSRKQT